MLLFFVYYSISHSIWSKIWSGDGDANGFYSFIYELSTKQFRSNVQHK